MAMKFVMNEETKEIVLVYPDGKQRTSDSLESILLYEILNRVANLEKMAGAMSGIKISDGKKEPDREPEKSK